MRTPLHQGLRAFLLGVTLAVPSVTFAQSAQSFEITGWIPYWRSQLGVESILPNLSSFTEVNPFMYTVRTNGTLNEATPLTSQEWQTLKTKAKEQGVKFIPTIMWSNPDAIHEVLSDPAKRSAHIQEITRAVFAHNLDGIDIDYEGKYARTRPYFSQFLKELYDAIGYNKWVMCTIESRTPLDSVYSSPDSIPKDIEFSNDFPEINKYCDRVRIMAYDQGRYDLKLNAAKGHPYAPVADVDWVEKVITLAAKDIDKSKLVIGIPTYGYEYDMFSALDGSGRTEYSRLWSFNPRYATDLAAKLGVQPARNASGEMVVTYPASQSPDGVIPLPQATRVMSWSDAFAIQQKVELAKKLGVRGVALFKIDGGEDQGVWPILAAHTTDTPIAKAPTPTPSEPDLSTPGTTPSTPAPVLAVPGRNLERGMRNEDVRTMQKFLNAHGFTVASSGGGSPGNETIFFGPATQTALKKFQQSHGIKPVSGYYGPLTRAKFNSLQQLSRAQ